MSRDSLHAQLIEVLNELFDTPSESVVESARLYEDLDVDSIDIMDLLLQLKKIKGNQINPEQFRDVRTVGQVLDVLEGLETE